MNLSLSAHIGALLRLRMVRFALVGGAGIPMNMALLWLFHGVAHMPITLAWICAFEPSAMVNFYANQRFTYGEQHHLHGWDWPKRALKAQASSLTGQAVNVLTFVVLLHWGLHYLPADGLGIVAAFTVNFLLANRFVFTAPAPLPALLSEQHAA